MSRKLFVLAVLGIILYTFTPTQAGVLRNTEEPADSGLEDTQTKASDLPESITTDPTFADSATFSRDEDATVRTAIASLDPAPGLVDDIEITLDTVGETKEQSNHKEEEEKHSETEAKSTEENSNSKKDYVPVLGRDEVATIKVNANESDDLTKDVPLSSAEHVPNAQPSSKLLLLSTPPLTREQEENIAEPEDVDINTAVSTDETTELSIEAKTENQKSSEESSESEEDHNSETTDKPSFITRVHDALFGKKSADGAAKVDENSEDKEEDQKPSVPETNTQDNDAIKKDEAAAEQAPETPNNNAAATVLIENEADYVLVDSDVEHLEHLGSFTHADSEEYLQPIVHSVEVVPTHFEEPLLFTSGYVHAW